MSPDRAAPLSEAELGATPPTTPPAGSAGALEVLLPLWQRRWWLLAGGLLGMLLGLGACLPQPVRYTAQASFAVQPLLRASPSGLAAALPALAGLSTPGGSAVDLYVTILRSQTMSDRIIQRFELQQAWQTPYRTTARLQLARRVSFGVGRRDGVVVITVEDEAAPRAAAMANQYIEELRAILRNFALDEARQRRQFYDAQLARARGALDEAQRKLQSSGFDRAALRAEPRAAAEAYGRMQAEVTATEVRLAATRRVRTEGSAEILQLQSELEALRAQLARLEAPKDDGPGSFVARVREFRYAETLAESVARQAEVARVDEAADAMPLQTLDRAQLPEWPSSPRLPMWLVGGALLGLLLVAAVVLLRHRMALARLDPLYTQRVAFLRALPMRRSG
jgi:uncharacterized protein involved in exopolysaccharide biosynthesis